jgi:hypothetical protein
MLEIRRFLSYVATTSVLIGCASAPRTDESVATGPSEPCAVRPADTDQWKQVKGDGFTFCVPIDWQKRSSQSWHGEGGTVTWSFGPTRRAIVVQRMGSPSAPASPSPIPNAPGTSRTETIGGIAVTIRTETTQTGYNVVANWGTSQLNLIGETPTAEGAALCLEIIRTVRITR